MKTLVSKSVIAVLIAGSALNAFGLFEMDIDGKIQSNKSLIKEYEERIKYLKDENKYLNDEKAKNPSLYIKKPLYEDLKDKYIYRVKLNGAKTDKLNFIIKDNIVSIDMNMKSEQKDKSGYFYSSKYFSNSFSVPSGVEQEKIMHKIDGDYFEIIMPKKK
jgi:HSP20 family molecular chaperone IbpA